MSTSYSFRRSLDSFPASLVIKDDLLGWFFRLTGTTSTPVYGFTNDTLLLFKMSFHWELFSLNRRYFTVVFESMCLWEQLVVFKGDKLLNYLSCMVLFIFLVWAPVSLYCDIVRGRDLGTAVCGCNLEPERISNESMETVILIIVV